MKKENEIAPRQEYVGWADVESVEYKYPPRNAVKYVLRIKLVGSSSRVWREIAVPSTIKLTSLAYVVILAMGWEESHLSMFKKWRKEYHVYMDGADMYGYKEMLKVIKEDPDSEEAWEYYTWLGSKWKQ